jgi:hypothetical protein
MQNKTVKKTAIKQKIFILTRSMMMAVQVQHIMEIKRKVKILEVNLTKSKDSKNKIKNLKIKRKKTLIFLIKNNTLQ